MTNVTVDEDRPLFILAFDHRSVLRAIYGDEGFAHASVMKAVVANALIDALADRREWERFGLLIDPETGAAQIPIAQSHGILVSVPIERSGARVFTIDRPDYLEQLAQIHPDHAKALVFLNPENEDYSSQLDDLAPALAAVAAAGHSYILEFVVPPTPAQLASVGGDELRFDTEVRPDLVRRVLAECYRRGIRPALWKIEGLETAEAFAAVAAEVAQNDPSARSIVLGRGAPEPRVARWLQLAAATPGFIGFAIGRSIWQEGLAELEAKTATPDAASHEIAQRFLHYCNVYRAASLKTTSAAV